MAIIFDEVEHGRNLLENGFKRFISLRDLSIVAKYLREEQGLSFKKIECELFSFCKKNNPDFNEVKNSMFIQRAINTAKKYYLRRPEPVIITKNEMEKIKNLNNYQYEKVLFVMLVIAKFFKFGVKKKVGKKAKLLGYFSNVRMADVLIVAKMRMNKQRRNEMLHFFYLMKYVDTTYTGGLRICYADDTSEPEVIISDYKNILSYYKPYCIQCGKNLERENKLRLCEDCRKNYYREWGKERVRKSRNKTM